MEDLLHKHELVEADITAQAERVSQSNKAADEFVEKASSDDEDGKRTFTRLPINSTGKKSSVERCIFDYLP